MNIKEYIKNFKYKTKPLQHQLEAIEYGLKNPKFLLLDEQGLGKSLESIIIAVMCKELFNYKHCLIVSGVASLRYNWKKEVEKHSYEEAIILGERIKKDGGISIKGIKERLDDLKHIDSLPYFIIVNIETLRDEEIVNALISLIKEDKITMIIADEIHRFKNVQAKQTKGFIKLKTDTLIGMSGTPIMNNPLECYTPLNWIGAEKHNYYQFRNYYCYIVNNIVSHYKHLDDLKEMINKHSLRRLRKDVLDLPPKIINYEFLEMSSKQRDIYNEVLRNIKKEIDKIRLYPDPRAMMTRLRQATSDPSILSSTIKESVKFDRLEDLCDELCSNGKVIVFSNFEQVIFHAYDRLKRFNPAIYTGQIKNFKEQEDKFHNDDTCRVILGTIGKMGTGLTLTEASTVIFIDEPWNRALKEQAEDRAYRIGTTKTVSIITLICNRTIDEKIMHLVNNKGKIADFLVDGIKPRDKEDFVNYLLNL